MVCPQRVEDGRGNKTTRFVFGFERSERVDGREGVLSVGVEDVGIADTGTPWTSTMKSGKTGRGGGGRRSFGYRT